jgi:hypothetical protein
LVIVKFVSIFSVPPYLAAGFVPGTEVAGAVVAGFDVGDVVCGVALVVAAGALEVVVGEEVVDVEQALMNSIEINEIASSIRIHFFIRHNSYQIHFEIYSADRLLSLLYLYFSNHRHLPESKA